MTLILTVLTPDHIIQVSDMRLSAGSEILTETAAKTIVWQGRCLIGYTGWACSDGESTDQWVASTGSTTTSVNELCESLAREADRRVTSVEGPRALTIVGGSWEEMPDSEDLAPCWFEVSNRGEDGGVLPAFHWSSKPVPPNKWQFHARGLPIDMRWVPRQLRRLMETGQGVSVAVETLATAIRAVDRSAVGKGLLISFLPRTSVPTPITIRFAEPLDWSQAQFLYAPDDPTRVEYRAPAWSGGGMPLQGFVAWGGSTAEQVPWPPPDDEFHCPPVLSESD